MFNLNSNFGRLAKCLKHSTSFISRSPITRCANPLNQLRMASSATATGTKTKDLDLRGVYPPIATPFTENEEIDYDKLNQNMEIWNTIPFRGYVVQGSNGECIFLNYDERIQMVMSMRQMAPSDRIIIAGSGCESTRETIWMTEQMAHAGADAALVVTPCYYKGRMTNPALIKHFTEVANKSPVPILVYNVPGNTGIDLAAEVVATLADHPNIIGWKDSSGDVVKMSDVIYQTRDKSFQTLAGSASFLLPALAAGAVGGVCALANVMGGEVCRLQRLHEEGKHEEARDLQLRLVGPNSGVTKKYGVPGLKAAMEWFGYFGGRVRSPLVPLTDDEYKGLQRSFHNSGFQSQ